MAGKGPGKLSRKAEQAIAALLQNSSIAAAAKACGVGERTLWRWLRDEDFIRHYRAAQRAVVDSAIAEIQGATSEAVATLRRNLNCGNAFAENTAAQTILTQSLKTVELEELQARIEKLEAAINEYRKKVEQN